jgi:hypothetical protein
MSRATVVLGWRDGWLCAVETDTRHNEPIQDTLYWPLFRDSKAVWDADLGKPLRREGPYGYSLGWRRFRLAQEGQTTSLAVESAPVPKPPRIRVPLRWHSGGWQKYDRTKGWITA